MRIMKQAGTAFVCALVGLGAYADQTQAINIVLNFDSGQSVNPTQDSNASGLQALFAHAESFYQDVFEDIAPNTTLTINFWYEDLDTVSSPSTLGLHNLVNESQSGGIWRETEANIRIDNDRTWFIDPTPSDNSEFEMGQIFWRDLTSTEQSDFFNNFTATNIPDTFEVGYRGNAVAGGAADGVLDMLSTVMHEVGHALGMSASATGTQNETGVDLDYDFDPAFIFGQSLAVEADSGSEGHIDEDYALMCQGCGATGVRRLPSHTDLFAMAAGNNYSQLDVPRREYYGGTFWNTDGNWSGNQAPGAADDVFVRNPGSVVTANLNANGFAANLTVAEGGNVDTEGFKLDVGGTVLVTDLNTDIFIRNAGELEANTLRIENQGEVRPETGGLIDVNTLDINDTGLLSGAGTVDVASTLSNDGTITANGGTLTFTTTGGAVWNLDGANTTNPTINANNGDINFASGTLADAFDGTMNVGLGRFINFANGWELGSGGTLNLNGGTTSTDRAEVSGDAVIRGDINVDKRGELDGATTFHSSANITINDADDRLDIGNSTTDTITYNGGTFTGSGLLVQDGDATVSAGSTVNIDVTFDFDGDTISDTTIESGATMNITGAGINDPHDGVITINSGTLNVATGTTIDLGGGLPIFLPNPWEMSGTLIFLDNGADPVLQGSKVNITGAVQVPITGSSRIEAPVEFHPTSTTEVTSASDRLVLDGVTTYNGGSYTGFGEIEQNGNATVSGATVIATGEFDMDGANGSTTISLDSDLTLNVTNIDDGNNNFNGTLNINNENSTLTVNTPDPWVLANTLNITTATFLTLPAISGQDFTLSGTANITGSTRFDARVDITGAIVFADGSSRLAILGGDLSNPNTISGGTVSGPAGSSLRTTSGNALVGNGTINVRLDFLNGSELLADNGTLNVPGNFISMGVIGTNDTDGILNVTSSWNTNTATELQLNGGQVTGAAITNGGTTVGFGEVATTGAFSNENLVHANGGLLTLNPAGGLDLDGAGEIGTVRLDGDLTVSSSSLDTGNDVFDGTINVNSSAHVLTVNTASPWTMNGVMNITTGTNLTFPSVAGQDFTLSGTANIDGGTRFDARVDLTGTVNLLSATSRLAVLGGDLLNPNTIDGGTVNGPAGSSLRAISGDALVGNGTINVQLDFLAGSELLADNGTLVVPGNFISMGVIGTNDIDGFLRVTSAWNTNTATELQLNGGSVIGASITNGGLTTGFGTIAPTGDFINDNILTANGGDLTLNPAATLDLDGAGNTGTINAVNGNVIVPKTMGLTPFAGTLNIGAGQTFSMLDGGLDNTGTINMTGGTYSTSTLLVHQGTLNVNGAMSDINAITFFENGSNSTINHNLRLLQHSTVRSNANINGTGSLIVAAGTVMTAENNAQIGVELINRGNFNIRVAGAGVVITNDFTQHGIGQINFDLGGYGQGVDYDWLKVSDNATLNGILDVNLMLGFSPVIGDTFEIITAGFGVAGTFSNVNLPTIPFSTVGLGVTYTANSVLINAGLLGDLDGDGFVGISDLNIILGNWNGNVDAGVWLQGDPSGDGFVGIEDLNVVLGNWNAGTPPTINALDSVPEPAVLTLFGIGCPALLGRRRC
ncbi:MAG: hypothetical protein Kow00105_02930 [Phycisphaeraceae bacterium]